MRSSILSISSPGLSFVGGDTARELARSVNENARALIEAHPDRFGAFALLPLPDIDASLNEISYALDGQCGWGRSPGLLYRCRAGKQSFGQRPRSRLGLVDFVGKLPIVFCCSQQSGTLRR